MLEGADPISGKKRYRTRYVRGGKRGIWFEEAHHSTAIEGNTLVLKQVELLLAGVSGLSG